MSRKTGSRAEGTELSVQRARAVFMRLVHTSAAVFAPVCTTRVYSKYQYSIFVPLDIRAPGTDTGATGTGEESEFAIPCFRLRRARASRADFASSSLTLCRFTLVFQRHYHRLLFPGTKLLCVTQSVAISVPRSKRGR